jgi:hypothetical protein
MKKKKTSAANGRKRPGKCRAAFLSFHLLTPKLFCGNISNDCSSKQCKHFLFSFDNVLGE